MTAKHITIDLADQSLTVFDGSKPIKRYLVSSARNGIGQIKGSGCTPLGRHYVRAKIGANLPMRSVLTGRRPTGEIYSPELAQANPDRDWILSRILWLCGMDIGLNRFGNVDTMRRYIYIHGTPDSEPMGIPLSHGCIRMRNNDVVELFDLVSPGTRVNIINTVPND